MNKILAAMLLTSALVGTGCASGTRAAGSRPAPTKASNSVAFTGPTLGTEELFTNACRSGEGRVFRGVDIFDETTKDVLVLRLVIDPLQGAAVRLFRDSEDGPSVILRKSDCETFLYELGHTGKSVNFVSEMKVSLQLDCRTKKDDSIVGKVDLPACL